MTSAKSTKRAFLASVIAMLLCFTMLLGTTYAWFTDSVTNSGNKIVAGTLDVQLLMDADRDGNYDDISDNTSPIFGDGSIAQDNNAETLWEPGKTQVAYLAIRNNGNLDLKYTVGLTVNNVSNDLYKVMEYDIVENANATTSPVTSWVDGEGVQVGAQSVSGDVALAKGVTHYFALVIHMDEDAGNDYMGGQVNFDLTVLATQLTSESDSFNNRYDKDAEFAIVVSDEKGLASALAYGGNVVLEDNVTVTEPVIVPQGVSVNLDLNGKTIEGTGVKQVDTIQNYGTLNITGGTVSSIGNDGGSALRNYGTMIVTDVTINGAPYAGIDGWWPSYAVNNYGTMTITDSEIKSEHGAVASVGGTATLNNVNATMGHATTTSHALYTNNGGAITVNGGNYKNTAADQSSTGASVINGAVTVNAGTFSGRIENYFGTPSLKGGIFDSDPTAYVAEDYIAVDNGDGTWTVKLNTVTGSTLKDQLKDNSAGKVIAGEDIDLGDTEYQQSGNMMSITIADGKTLDLNNNSVIRPASGSGSGVVIPGGATTTVKNGSIVSEGDMTCIDVTYGAEANFENMTFVGNGSGFARVRANNTAKTTVVFKGCTFVNASVEIKGMNGACDVDVQFIDCTFTGSYKMYDENGNLLTDPHGNVHYTTELVSVCDSYVMGKITFDNCTFDLDASESNYDRAAIEVTGPKAGYGTLTVTLKDVTVTGKNIVPVELDSRYSANVTIVEEGTTSYTVDGVAVNFDGSAK